MLVHPFLASRLALENALKYGWRYNPLKLLPGLTIGNPNVLLALCYPLMLLMGAASLAAEILAFKLMEQEKKVCAHRTLIIVPTISPNLSIANICIEADGDGEASTHVKY